MTARYIQFLLLLVIPLSILIAETQAAPPPDLDKQLDAAYSCLSRFNACKTRDKSLELLQNFYQQKKTVDVILALLNHDYTYNNPRYRPSVIAMDESDKLVEKMIRILGKNGDPRSFEALLGIVIYPDRHRPETVSAAYDAMTKLKWDQWKPDAQ